MAETDPDPRSIASAGSAERPMAHVSVTINDRQYRMACEEGEEAHLLRLAKELDQRIEELRGRFGEIGDTRLIVMAAITVADELAEAGKRIRQLEEQLSGMHDVGTATAERSKATQAAIAAALNSAAERIERVIKSLNQGLGEEIAVG
jgi:cell division protein ZapA